MVTAKLNGLKVMVATDGDIPQNVNFALKSSVAMAFLESIDVPFTAGVQPKMMEQVELAELARQAAVAIKCEPQRN